MDVEKWVGATRPLVTLILIVTLCYIVVISVDPASVDFKDFLNLVMIVALFWFKSRDEEKQIQKSNEIIAQITATQPAPPPPPVKQ